jgi:transcriptional regulator with XRE-family HTH domain
MDGLYEEFGLRFRKRRNDAGLTQSQVAERVGLTRTSITNIERGRQHIVLHQLFLLASAVGTKPEELLPDTKPALETLVSAQTLKALRGSENTEDLAVIAQVLKKAQASPKQRKETKHR